MKLVTFGNTYCLLRFVLIRQTTIIYASSVSGLLKVKSTWTSENIVLFLQMIYLPKRCMTAHLFILWALTALCYITRLFFFCPLINLSRILVTSTVGCIGKNKFYWFASKGPVVFIYFFLLLFPFNFTSGRVHFCLNGIKINLAHINATLALIRLVVRVETTLDYRLTALTILDWSSLICWSKPEYDCENLNYSCYTYFKGWVVSSPQLLTQEKNNLSFFSGRQIFDSCRYGLSGKEC